MRIGRTLPPAAAPLTLSDLYAGLKGLVRGQTAVDRFTEELRQQFTCRYVIPVSSGKAALTLILQALKVARPKRDGVLIPAFTCYSVPSAIVKAGLKVHLCDVDPATLDFDYAQLQQKLTDPSLLCVVPVNLFGLPADVAKIRELCPDPELAVVEDAAQAMGGISRGQLLGTRGDVGFFSLGRGKALSTVEGGLILTNRDDLGQRLEGNFDCLESYGSAKAAVLFLYALALWILSRPSLFWLPKSIPFLRLGETIFETDFPLRRLSGLQAGLAARWPERLAALQQGRRRAVQAWQHALPANGLPADMGDHPLIRFPVMTASADEAVKLLKEGERLGLGLAPAYPQPIHRVPELAAAFAGQNYPGASTVAQRLLTLPVHEFVREKDRRKIQSLLQLSSPLGSTARTTNMKVGSVS